MSATYSGTSYVAAASFLAAGKAKAYRPSGSTRYLIRQTDDSISLVLHSTAVVTYHADDTITLYHGGWTTVTTLQTINGATPFRIGSTYDRKHPGWGLGYTGEITAPRVQRCRMCKGLGGTVTRKRCYGPGWQAKRCNGPQTRHGVPWSAGWDAYSASVYTVPCEHGAQFEGSHRLELCKHGQRDAHDYGDRIGDASACYRCDGTGSYDYGSKRVPIVWQEHGAAVRMSADGTVIDLDAPRYDAPGKPGKGSSYSSSYSSSYVPSSPHSMGSEVGTKLRAALPALATQTHCPACTDTRGDIAATVVHLNDSHRWTREAIADWLDTLDADLRFPSSA